MSTAKRWVEEKHYLHSLGFFWNAYALIEDDQITGIVVYGPPSAPTKKFAFIDCNFRIYQLTRLVIQSETKNAASFLIANSMKQLPSQPCAVVSYADDSMGHCGIVYQATNWLYTGRLKDHVYSYLYEGEVYHSRTITRMGYSGPAEWAKKVGATRIPKRYKYRYFNFVGSKNQKKRMKKKLKYEIIFTSCKFFI